MGRFGHTGLTAPQQLLHLRSSKVFPGVASIWGQTLTWRGDLKPSGLSRNYKVRMAWSEGDPPEVFVDDPDLSILAGGARLPHVYEERPARLCLYLPGTGEFRQTDRLDLTVLPWTQLWLAYFEDWLARGCSDWQGGGEHPSGRVDEPRAIRRAIVAQRRRTTGHGSYG